LGNCAIKTRRSAVHFTSPAVKSYPALEIVKLGEGLRRNVVWTRRPPTDIVAIIEELAWFIERLQMEAIYTFY
jgi:hypothetical protein